MQTFRYMTPLRLSLPLQAQPFSIERLRSWVFCVCLLDFQTTVLRKRCHGTEAINARLAHDLYPLTLLLMPASFTTTCKPLMRLFAAFLRLFCINGHKYRRDFCRAKSTTAIKGQSTMAPKRKIAQVAAVNDPDLNTTPEHASSPNVRAPIHALR